MKRLSDQVAIVTGGAMGIGGAASRRLADEGASAVPGRWWLSPSDFHSSLAPEQWGGIRPWYLLGVAAFTFSFGGGLIALAGLLLLG